MYIIQNEFFDIFEDKEKLYIKTKKEGYDIANFSNLSTSHPQISIKYFLNLKNALEKISDDNVEIGILKPKIELSISKDNTEAYFKLNISNDEFKNNKQQIIDSILSELDSNNIVHGIIHTALDEDIKTQENILIAKATPSKNGQDAIIKYLDLPDKKPNMREDGSTNYYEMNLILEVNKHDYLGEKIPLTKGVDGLNIKGDAIPAKPGKNKRLSYDRKTVGEFKEDNKIILRALTAGALSHNQGKVSVIKHLVIDGDVGYETGNIFFDGSVTVKGTVCDDFKVIATEDISIDSIMGIGAAEKIVSTNGDIYVKGGVCGKGKTLIHSKKSVFVKYANSCTIIAEDTINIGFYSLDSILESKSILLNPEKGKIIGGKISAYAKVVTGAIGNSSERKTIVNVKGFDRKQIKKELDELLIKYSSCLLEMEKNKKEMEVFENTVETTEELIKTHEYEYYNNIHEKLTNEISELDQKRKYLTDCLHSKGEGEISILKNAHPQTFLEIKNLQKIIKKETSGTFYAQDNSLHSE
ncbi:DUF342 domain-containing protein [Tepidibacter hydrothermalis]|uniref:FapA family protein n=1 Tax=Tepidibacter hydrothermalis TaxID=3036126 RepID=A0ABY8EI10_9FIRM|nr:FapA family protein [Tepidibacter hydrothermalis]WFD11202.1 FapA family protein [Tepidibacter hydrothermalis]